MSMTTASPRKIFNDWEENGLPALKNANTDGTYLGDVIVSTIDAGETHLGEVGQKLVYSSATIAFSITAYAALDGAGSGAAAYGGIEFRDAARVAGGNGVIRGALFTEDAIQEKPDFTMILFTLPPGTTHGLDNATFKMATADVKNFAGTIMAGTSTSSAHEANASKAWLGLAASCSVQFVPTAIPFVCGTGTSLYARIRADAAFNPAAAGNIKAKLLIEQN